MKICTYILNYTTLLFWNKKLYDAVWQVIWSQSMKEFHIHVISVIIGTDAVLKAIQSHFMKEFHIHVIIVIVDQYISCDIILFTCVGFIQDAIIFNLFKNIYQIPPPPDPQRFTQSKFFP